MTQQSPSVMSKVLDYLGKQRLPKNRGEIVVDWAGALSEVPGALLHEHYLCPCECLVADEDFGMEIQHHDGVFGDIHGPVGFSFADGIKTQSANYNNMQALVAPNLAPPIRTVIITKVATDSLNRVVQLWGAAQEGVGRAVTDAYEHKWFPAGYERSHVLIAGVFIHPFAGLAAPEGEGAKFDKKKFLKGDAMEASMHAIYGLTYLGTLGLLADALTGGLTPEERIERAKTTKHPFRGFKAVEAATA